MYITVLYKEYYCVALPFPVSKLYVSIDLTRLYDAQWTWTQLNKIVLSFYWEGQSLIIIEWVGAGRGRGV